jgi:hypothetical protein
MIRMFALGFVWIVLATSLAHTAPAQPRYEPPELPTFIDLRGTSWQGQDHVANYRVTFESDGTLTFGYNNKFNRGGSWALDGNKLYFEVNKKYREFKGTVNGSSLQGDSWNVTGKRWQTNLQRVDAIK